MKLRIARKVFKAWRYGTHRRPTTWRMQKRLNITPESRKSCDARMKKCMAGMEEILAKLQSFTIERKEPNAH